MIVAIGHSPIKICFIAPYAYSLFNQATGHVFGGSEVRAWRFATALARRPGFDVSFVVFDHGQPDGETWNRVRLVKQRYYRSFETAPQRRGLTGRVMRRLTDVIGRRLGPTPARIGRHRADGRKFIAYENADADVFVGFGVTDLTAELIAHGRGAGKRVVLFAGSDNDFSERYVSGSYAAALYGNTPHLCHYAITTADTVIVQTEHQRALCRARFGRRADAVIANPADLGDAGDRPAGPGTGPVLWIGKSDEVKRPDILLDMARRFPTVPFHMLMNRSDAALHAQILASCPANVTITESMAYDEADALFRGARALVNTSVFEGFPNTFLQAGRHGIPILSLSVDPDGFIAEHGCGIAGGGDLAALVRGIDMVLNDAARARAFGRAAGDYVRRHHDNETQVAKLEAVLAPPRARSGAEPAAKMAAG